MKTYPFIKDNKGFSQLVPMVLAVVITFALLFIGAYVNGTIHDELDGSLSESEASYDARRSMNNTSGNWDSAIDIVQVVIIITILAGAIGAIFLFTRFR